MMQTIAVTADGYRGAGFILGREMGNWKVDVAGMRGSDSLIGKLLQQVLLRQFFYDEFDEPIDYFFRRFRIE